MGQGIYFFFGGGSQTVVKVSIYQQYVNLKSFLVHILIAKKSACASEALGTQQLRVAVGQHCEGREMGLHKDGARNQMVLSSVWIVTTESHAAKSASNFIVQMCPSCAWVVVPDVYFQLFSGGTLFCLHCLNNLYCVTCIPMSNESLAHWINNHWYIMKGFNLQPLSFGPYAKISRKRAVIVWKPKRLQMWFEMEKITDVFTAGNCNVTVNFSSNMWTQCCKEQVFESEFVPGSDHLLSALPA